MTRFLVNVYRFFFAKEIFEKWNILLYRLSLSGLGVLNFESSKASGESYFLKEFLCHKDSDGVIIDVGANQGEYSLMCEKFSPGVEIFALEPHPRTFSLLSANLQNLNARCFNEAVGSDDGVLNLYDYKLNDGSSHASVYREVIECIHREDSVSHQVKVISIDTFVKDQKIRKIRLLKIDTEGHEFEVLKGATEALRLGIVGAIHFEFNEMNVISRIFFKDFVDLLGDYDLYRLLPTGMIKISYSPVCAEIFAYQNIVAIHRRQTNFV